MRQIPAVQGYCDAPQDFTEKGNKSGGISNAPSNSLVRLTLKPTPVSPFLDYKAYKPLTGMLFRYKFLICCWSTFSKLEIVELHIILWTICFGHKKSHLIESDLDEKGIK